MKNIAYTDVFRQKDGEFYPWRIGDPGGSLGLGSAPELGSGRAGWLDISENDDHDYRHDNDAVNNHDEDEDDDDDDDPDDGGDAKGGEQCANGW